MQTKTYTGFLHERYWQEAGRILFLDAPNVESDSPLAEILEEDISEKKVSARYFICNKECSLEEAQTSFVKQLSGDVDTDVGAHYSEITGYLWTDEEIRIGGHDLIAELHYFIGKWLILIVDIEEV